MKEGRKTEENKEKKRQKLNEEKEGRRKLEQLHPDMLSRYFRDVFFFSTHAPQLDLVIYLG